ncbi:non-heme iron oxygenase ferredoxin subunit [bacterium]|nr:MAG: non-heme iron oxygenase ferredoxin subunit [bacterium]
MQVTIDGLKICLARSGDGSWHAISDVCTHEEYSLSEGDIWGNHVECALHGSRFNLVTGEPDQLPARTPVRVYQVEVRGGSVFVKM